MLPFLEPRGMQIFVKTLTGNEFTLNAEASDTVDNVKAQIQEIAGIPFHHQCLLFRSRPLLGSLLIGSVCSSGDTLFLALRLRGGPEFRRFDVWIKPDPFDDFKFKITTTEDVTISALKHELQQEWGYPSRSTRIWFDHEVIGRSVIGGSWLKDDDTVGTSGIYDNALLVLQQRRGVKRSAVFQALDNAQQALDVAQQALVITSKALDRNAADDDATD